MTVISNITSKERPSEIPSLTGLRFFAALFVVFYHYYDLHGKPTESLFTRFQAHYLPFLSNSHLMVDLFFIMSGFVLSHVYFKSINTERFSIYEFLFKRIARIYPLHILTMLFMLFGTAILSTTGTEANSKIPGIGEFIAQVTMTHAWGFCERSVLNIPSWSISAEWFAYLCFPLVSFLILRSHAITSLFMAIIWFVAVCNISEMMGTGLTLRTYDFGILRVIADFPLGIALFHLYNTKPVVFPHSLFWITVLSVLLLMSFSNFHSITILMLGALTYVAASAEREKKLALISSGWCVYGGTISYSLYLWHAPVLAVFSKLFVLIGIYQDTPANDVALAFTILASLGLSVLSYEFVENPARRYLCRALTPAGLLATPDSTTDRKR